MSDHDQISSWSTVVFAVMQRCLLKLGHQEVSKWRGGCFAWSGKQSGSLFTHILPRTTWLPVQGLRVGFQSLDKSKQLVTTLWGVICCCWEVAQIGHGRWSRLTYLLWIEMFQVQNPNNHKTPTPLLFFYDSISISSSYTSWNVPLASASARNHLPEVRKGI